MGIKDIHALKPGDDPNPELVLEVTDQGNGMFKITGSDSVVSVISGTRFRLTTSLVNDHGDGTYTATSG